MKTHIPPVKVKAGDDRLKINGRPPRVDCRVIAENEYQILREGYDLIQRLKFYLQNN